VQQPEYSATPTGHITVRQAVFADLEALATLFDRYRQFQGQASDLAAARAFLAARFNHGESVVFIAHADSVPLGFAQIYPSYSSVSMARVFVLNDLFVDEAARRQGVASNLLGAVEAYAWAHGSVRVTLNVARDNPSGQALYEALGWHQDAQFHMYHRFPADTDPHQQ
jgi:GNAT superfamily N-acetyltransferase